MGGSAPPAFARMTADPLRWRLLRELSGSDRRVRELVSLSGEPQSLVSYHLRQLRASGLVGARRSSFDGRDTYYHLDLLHPGLAPGPPAPAPGVPHRTVLFLCTGNSARSRAAQALAQARSGGRVRAFSAGSHPKPLHPHAVRAMAARGVSLAQRPSRHLSEFATERFDYVISLCDRVREVCPRFPGHPGYLHWSIPDPAASGSGGDTYPAFERMAAELESRIGFWLAGLAAAARP
jgi:ArsR family transcriptional regulator, arsenate/arsenite/antimonite-responsive transcriptional repressor / arsenate reductase (thioredoxin)